MRSVVIVGLIALFAGSACDTGSLGVVDQSNKATVVQMTATLQSAGEAENEYFGLNNTYTSDVNALMAGGLNIPARVKLSIPTADASGYCVQAAGGVTSSSTWHMKSDQQVPMPGACV